MKQKRRLLGKEYVAPWERAFDKVLSPLEEFIHRQTTSGVLLMLCAVIALILANSHFAETYHHLFQTYLTIGLENFQLSKSLHHWINDGLMAIFFLVVGLELKRELLVGELANVKQALLPIIAAVGGMLVPALIYVAINPTGHTSDGWGIPMATDIAFALGALALLGKRVPQSLLMFLVALAIVDDLGAVIVIAIFYTEALNMTALALVAFFVFALISLNLAGVRRLSPYLLIGTFLWIAMLKSGIHATLAGVILAFTIPMKPKYDPKRFLSLIIESVQNIKDTYKKDENIIVNDALRSRVRALGNGVNLVQAPAQILESKLHLPSAYLVIPIFALANAGVPIDWSNIGGIVVHPVAMGIGAGLVAGKLIGIAGFTWVAVKLGVCNLPKGLNMHHIIGVAFMGGIGFTMSIFIAELGFADYPADLLMAKTGILFASLSAGITGFIWLYLTTKKKTPPVEEKAPTPAA
ncbi:MULTISPECIES: Na+/H+ antiporter NhaA [unclassified Neptuniibacter]|uniref:Na+/H+ antiporter NhaA n=1 Tax=unclassified Neptuniibacter TaxID=2630693 RepID=UPI0026E39858|nr:MULTISPECIES: Na+/H+ antiporter NhaA [unclassified Neptuniibacter]MDO6514124.1 Na+/H+ antiporter NhaA [Neptuniibacter sp. 2_MG-2023]MDO6594039.1 Na+/H+ antiporter NhaA [Neptuniibacter sp. 1_MG-2023]